MKLPTHYDELTQKERRIVREEYSRLQEFKCAHCGNPLDSQPSDEILSKPINRSLFPPNFFNWPVHLHHCHVTGMTIGAVHCRCNAVLWQYHGK